MVNKKKGKWHFGESPKRRCWATVYNLYKPSHQNITWVSKWALSVCLWNKERKKDFSSHRRWTVFRIFQGQSLNPTSITYSKIPASQFSLTLWFIVLSFLSISDPLFCHFVVSYAIPESLTSPALVLWYNHLSQYIYICVCLCEISNETLYWMQEMMSNTDLHRRMAVKVD